MTMSSYIISIAIKLWLVGSLFLIVYWQFKGYSSHESKLFDFIEYLVFIGALGSFILIIGEGFNELFIPEWMREIDIISGFGFTVGLIAFLFFLKAIELLDDNQVLLYEINVRKRIDNICDPPRAISKLKIAELDRILEEIYARNFRKTSLKFSHIETIKRLKEEVQRTQDFECEN